MSDIPIIRAESGMCRFDGPDPQAIKAGKGRPFPYLFFQGGASRDRLGNMPVHALDKVGYIQ